MARIARFRPDCHDHRGPIHYTVTHASTERDADVTYLPPTKENLALLTAPIPAGFTQQP